jgi:hypothetical protein
MLIKYLRFTILDNCGNIDKTKLNEFYLIDNLNNTVPLYPLIDPSFTITDPSIDPSYPITNLFDGNNFTMTQWNTPNYNSTTIKFNSSWSMSEYIGYAIFLDNGSNQHSYGIDNNPDNFIVELSSDNINWIIYSIIENQFQAYSIPHGLGGGSILYRFLFNSVCVCADTKILLEGSVYKKASELKRGDRVAQDVKTGAIKTISRVIVSSSDKCITIPKGLLGNTEDVWITENHPIWVNGDKNRICAKHLDGSERKSGRYDVYSIQFDEEGTFYAYGIKVDSISPNYHTFKLPRVQFIDRKKYNKGCIIREEDDPRRGKPPMIDHM